jgi:hypothetical protein
MNPILILGILHKVVKIVKTVTKKDPVTLTKEPVIMKSYILNRLAEPSSWRGLFALLTAAGISIAPDQQAAIVTLGLAAIGFIGTFFPDLKK